MEVVAFIVIGVLIFLLGWMTGNLVEWAMDYRQQRLTDKWIADVNRQMWAEERSDRE